MITENMKLKTKSDARQWASNYNLSDTETENLTNWIWEMKPEIGCTKEDHPLSDISDDLFWTIIEG